MEVKKYKKEAEYSYTLGAFPTLELVQAMPERVVEILVHSSFTDRELIEGKCREAYEAGRMKHCRDTKPGQGDDGLLPIRQDDKTIGKLADKENVYVVGVFEKYTCELKADTPHLVLVNPSNMGNLGTIMRTACGFGYNDIAIIEPAADIFNPKTVRASMGSLFRIRHEMFASFEAYLAKFTSDRAGIKADAAGVAKPTDDAVSKEPKDIYRKFYPFMLDGSCRLQEAPKPSDGRFSLIFGNEATGLPHEFAGYGCPVRIEQTEFVDSLNLTIAAGIGMYAFKEN
ncbi:MAG: TrmH family RNA methyltransferase [Lachnospiraceae bacterium]|nr:TrmH family RNA methyltransferase [Lachnospiraceae bacterium]